MGITGFHSRLRTRIIGYVRRAYVGKTHRDKPDIVANQVFMQRMSSCVVNAVWMCTRDDKPDGAGRRNQAGGRGIRTRQLQGAQDIGARRSNRAQRKAARFEERLANQDVREEIFEVGPEGMPVAELATKLAINAGEVVKVLFMKGIMVQVNQVRGSILVLTLFLPFCTV